MSGYIGQSMSKNAAKAHEEGQYTISQVNATLLHNEGFYYPIAFYKWLCSESFIKPVAHHHTGVAFNLTKFYDTKSIRRAVSQLNLELLYQIYNEKWPKTKLIKSLDLLYTKVQIPTTSLGMAQYILITVDALKYKNMYWVSDKLWILDNVKDVRMIKQWTYHPGHTKWNNIYHNDIIRNIIMYKDYRSI